MLIQLAPQRREKCVSASFNRETKEQLPLKDCFPLHFLTLIESLPGIQLKPQSGVVVKTPLAKTRSRVCGDQDQCNP